MPDYEGQEAKMTRRRKKLKVKHLLSPPLSHKDTYVCSGKSRISVSIRLEIVIKTTNQSSISLTKWPPNILWFFFFFHFFPCKPLLHSCFLAWKVHIMYRALELAIYKASHVKWSYRIFTKSRVKNCSLSLIHCPCLFKKGLLFFPAMFYRLQCIRLAGKVLFNL